MQKKYFLPMGFIIIIQAINSNRVFPKAILQILIKGAENEKLPLAKGQTADQL